MGLKMSLGESLKNKIGQDAVELRPWTDFYKTFEFSAYECEACGYKFSWYRHKGQKA